MNTKTPPQYQSYLLRCMEIRTADPEQAEQDSAWRFSLQDTRNGERHHFADFETLVDYLRTEIVRSDSTLGDLNDDNQER